MSGAEVVSLVLGVLPLIISAAEHYEDVFKPIKRYRNFAPEVKLFQQAVGTQKTIFRNECHLLLATLTSRQMARAMLKEHTHPSWIDPELDEKFASQLGESGSACKCIVTTIEINLQEIEGEIDSYGKILQESNQVSTIFTKAMGDIDLRYSRVR